MLLFWKGEVMVEFLLATRATGNGNIKPTAAFLKEMFALLLPLSNNSLF